LRLELAKKTAIAGSSRMKAVKGETPGGRGPLWDIDGKHVRYNLGLPMCKAVLSAARSTVIRLDLL